MGSYQIKVYKIVNDDTDEIYVGSTKQSLAKRFLKHKSDYTTMNNGNKCSYCTSFILFDRYGTENCHILLLQVYDVISKEEQLMHERKHYDDLKELVVNKLKPHANVQDKIEQNKKDCKKYRESHKEQVAIDKKVWYEANKDAISATNCEVFACECGGSYTFCNKDRHCKTKIHCLSLAGTYKETIAKQIAGNKLARKLKAVEIITCECGETYTKSNKSRHLKSHTHQATL